MRHALTARLKTPAIPEESRQAAASKNLTKPMIISFHHGENICFMQAWLDKFTVTDWAGRNPALPCIAALVRRGSVPVSLALQKRYLQKEIL